MKHQIPNVNGGYGPMRSSTTKNLDTFFSVLTVLVGFTITTIGETVLSALGRVFYRMSTLLFSNPAELVATLKRASIWYVLIVRGVKMTNVQAFDSATDFFTARTVTGLPANTILWLRNIIKSTAPTTLNLFDQIVFALLSMHRLIVLPPVYDFSSITTPSTYNPKAVHASGATISEITNDEIRQALLDLGITPGMFQTEYKKACKNQNHMILSSAGPNGKASWTAYSDAVALCNERTVLKYLGIFAEQSKLTRFIQNMMATVRIPAMDNQMGENLYTGKIHTFEEWGGKTRNVAIVDYWTQLMLTPLHNTLFHFLRGIPTDATFDQDSAATYIKELTASSGAHLYSCDLTAATDRLPAILQQRILSILLSNPTLADAWVRIFSERSFHTAEKTLVKYAAGLPMGSKSNWAMLALTHHIIIQIAAKRAGQAEYSVYRVCGDDSVISNTDVYTHYIAIMAWYGVAINQTKSILHQSLLTPAAEFCKRVFVGGVELTTIPVKLIVKTVFNGRLVSQLQNEMIRRGFTLASNKWFDFFAALVDRESLEFIMLLNALPSSINGLIRSIRERGIYHNRSGWFGDSIVLEAKHFKNAYIYVLVTEQLKRLDTLLRQTEIIAQAIEAKTGGWVTPQFDTLVTTADGKTAKLLEILGWEYPELEFDHPIAAAAFVEVDRINNLLVALRSSDEAVSTSALSSLLESFRNSLVDAWSDPESARAQAERSLITRAMTVLGDIVSRPTVAPDNKTVIARSLNFTISLSYIKRVWTVSWNIDGNVELNAVKTRVLTSTTLASSTASSVADAFSVQTRFAKAPRKTVTPSNATPDISEGGNDNITSSL